MPWSSISSSPVEISLSGMDLLVTAQHKSKWQFDDIFSKEYLESKIMSMANEAFNKI